ncbi:MAG: heme ABC exporter ATP-binding protein CcmA [Lysobacterales bacterium]
MLPTESTGRISLTARNLGFARAGETIFGPMSLGLRGGSLCAIGGANGAGKTTLLQVLAGLLAPTTGTVECAHEADGLPLESAGRVALLGHHNGMKLDLSARANLGFRESLMSADKTVTIDEACARVGLAGYETLALRELSAGQRRRVALAALVRSRAPLWLLDEPFANLDQDGRSLVACLIAEQRERGGIVVITTHGVDALPVDTQHLKLGSPA